MESHDGVNAPNGRIPFRDFSKGFSRASLEIAAGNRALSFLAASETEGRKGGRSMKMVSFWKGPNGESTPPVQFYDEDDELFLIYGYYDHKNQSGGVKANMQKCIGVYWRDDYPSSHGVLTPCVIPPRTAKCLLKGLFLELLSGGEKEKAEKVSEAIRFLS